MFSIYCEKQVLDLIEYPEYSDDFWKDTGGWKNKMIQCTGDQHTNSNFNRHMYELLNIKPLRILDLGCGGGGFVEECINDGHISIGLDGNNYFKDLNLHSWSRIPNYFFIYYIGKKWTIYEDSSIMKFDIITTWEFLEHIYEEDVEQVARNIQSYSKIGTWLIFSASQRHRRPYHKTIQSREWWIELFTRYGFENTDINFDRDVIRWESDSIFGYMKYVR